MQVEIRAAGLYALGSDREPPFDNASFMALFGFANHRKRLDKCGAWPPSDSDSHDWWAGWLLGELATHHSREARDATAWSWRIDLPLAEQLAETATDDAAADALVRCDWHPEHGADDRPMGQRCEVAATHRIVWLDGSNRYSYGCDAHLGLDAEAPTVRIEKLVEAPDGAP